MKIKKQILFISTNVLLISLGMVAIADAALVGRLPMTLGGSDFQAYYDTDANITWLADANAPGVMTHYDAGEWARNLSISGVTGWRLPSVGLLPDPTCSVQSSDGYSAGVNCTGGDLGNLFYNVLGGVADTSISTTHNANYDLFSNIESDRGYWLDFGGINGVSAYQFVFDGGGLGTINDDFKNYVWAVKEGDVSPVPVPASVWLFSSGLIGLIGAAKRKGIYLKALG